MSGKEEAKTPEAADQKETTSPAASKPSAATALFSSLSKKGVKVDENGSYLDAEEDKRKESFLKDIMGFDEQVYSAMSVDVKDHLVEYTSKTLVPSFNKLAELAELEKGFSEVEEKYTAMKTENDELVAAANNYFSGAGIKVRANAKTYTEAMANLCTQLEISESALAAEQQKNAKQEAEYSRLMKMANVPLHLSKNMKNREEVAAYSGRQKRPRVQHEEQEDEGEDEDDMQEEEGRLAAKQKNKKPNNKKLDGKWTFETLKQYSAQGEIEDDESIEYVAKKFSPDQLNRLLSGTYSSKGANSFGMVSKRAELEPKSK